MLEFFRSKKLTFRTKGGARGFYVERLLVFQRNLKFAYMGDEGSSPQFSITIAIKRYLQLEVAHYGYLRQHWEHADRKKYFCRFGWLILAIILGAKRVLFQKICAFNLPDCGLK